MHTTTILAPVLLPMVVAAVLTTSTFYSCDTIVPKATIPPIAQISDGQVQASSATAVAQISDGQVQASSAAPVAQIGDGQIQASSYATPVAQISDGQIQASSTQETLTVQLTEYQTSQPTSTVVAGTASGPLVPSASATLAPFTGGTAGSSTVTLWAVAGAGAMAVFGIIVLL